MRLVNILLLISALVLLLLVGAVAYGVVRAGAFRTLEYHQDGACSAHLGVAGSEDLVVDRDTQTLYISSLDRRARGQEPPVGEILALSLSAGEEAALVPVSQVDFEFRPHGLGLLTTAAGEKFLFAVNHRSEQDTVEAFRVEPGGLRHVESFHSAYFRSLNDVYPVDERAFYVTVDHGFDGYWGRLAEEFLPLRKSSVLYYDGTTAHTAADGLRYANGIAGTSDGKRVFVADSLDRTVTLYTPQGDPDALEKVSSVDLGSGVDNIDIDLDGTLWIGAHPNLLQFLQYAEDRNENSPSQVLRVSMTPEGEWKWDEIMLLDGEYLSGSSVAVSWEGKVIVGSVLDQRFLICDLPPEPEEPTNLQGSPGLP